MMLQGIHHHHPRRLSMIALFVLALPFASSASFINPPLSSFSATSTSTLFLKNTRLAMSTTAKQGEEQQLRSVPMRDSWDEKAWANGFSTVETEECYELEGTDFPKDLQGTFFQNGHSKFNVGDEIMIHPFDGDGMVSAVTINKDGKAWYRNRYVQTPGYMKELQTGKIQYRNMFGTTRNRGKWWSNIFDLGTKNVANTHVLFVPGKNDNDDKKTKTDKLYALWEGARPFEMDPVTLQTLQPGQECDLHGSLDQLDRYAAHYKIDPDTGNVVNFGIGLGEKSTDVNHSHSVTIYEHDVHDNMQLLSKKKYFRSGFGMAHDVAISQNYLVMFQTPCNFNPLPWILGRKSLAQCITQDKTASTTAKLHLFPRDPSIVRDDKKSNDNGEQSPITIEIPMAFTFHTVNAFESNNGKTLSVDVVMTDRMYMAETESTKYPTKPVWDTINYSKDLPPYSIRRYTIDIPSRSLLDIKSMTGSWSKTVDFPTMHPSYVSKPYRYAYVLAGINPNNVTPVQGLCKVNVQLGQEIQKWIPPHEYQFLTELVFVPRGDNDNNNNDEDYGYLVGYLLNGRDLTSSEFVVFDAKDITKGPIAQARLKTGISHALHGTFVKGYTPSMDEALTSYKK